MSSRLQLACYGEKRFEGSPYIWRPFENSDGTYPSPIDQQFDRCRGCLTKFARQLSAGVEYSGRGRGQAILNPGDAYTCDRAVYRIMGRGAMPVLLDFQEMWRDDPFHGWIGEREGSHELIIQASPETVGRAVQDLRACSGEIPPDLWSVYQTKGCSCYHKVLEPSANWTEKSAKVASPENVGALRATLYVDWAAPGFISVPDHVMRTMQEDARKAYKVILVQLD